MDVEHCSFLHHTLMKRKMTSIFEKLLRGKKLYLLIVGKKKIGKTAENHEVTEHDCHQRGNLSSVYNILKLAVSKDLKPETFAIEKNLRDVYLSYLYSHIALMDCFSFIGNLQLMAIATTENSAQYILCMLFCIIVVFLIKITIIPICST